jgi:hypothetical protein
MKLSSDFCWNYYVNNWQIDYYRLSKEEKEYLSKQLKTNIRNMDHIFYKSGDDWCTISSGMVFDIKNLYWYPIMKKHLDNRFKEFIRNKKIEDLGF